MPSQLAIAVSASQFSVAVPRSVSFAASRTEQSATRPGLSAGLGTAVPFSQSGSVGVCVLGAAATAGVSATASRGPAASASDVALIAAAGCRGSGSGSALSAGVVAANCSGVASEGRMTAEIRPISSSAGSANAK